MKSLLGVKGLREIVFVTLSLPRGLSTDLEPSTRYLFSEYDLNNRNLVIIMFDLRLTVVSWVCREIQGTVPLRFTFLQFKVSKYE